MQSWTFSQSTTQMQSWTLSQSTTCCQYVDHSQSPGSTKWVFSSAKWPQYTYNKIQAQPLVSRKSAKQVKGKHISYCILQNESWLKTGECPFIIITWPDWEQEPWTLSLKRTTKIISKTLHKNRRDRVHVIYQWSKTFFPAMQHNETHYNATN